MHWEACSALGICRTVPFFNREILELAFACHPTELYGPGPKLLRRRALRANVPEQNLQRPDQGGWGRFPAGVAVARAPAGGGAAGGSAGVVGEEWLAQPRQEVDYWPLRFLTRLGLFGAALRAQRQASP